MNDRGKSITKKGKLNITILSQKLFPQDMETKILGNTV